MKTIQKTTTMKFKKHHGKENNQESQEIYDLNLGKLNNNCRTIFEQLLTGARLTGMDVVKLGIMEYRKRFDDLKKIYKLPVKDERPEKKFGKGKERYKVWYLEKEFINNWNNAL